MKKPRRLNANGLWEYALRVLGARALSSAELRQRLTVRAAEPGDIAPTLARLKEQGYLEDKRFAESFAAARLDNQGFGRSRVLRDLRNRRVAPAVAEKAVGQVYRDVDETALIEDFVARKILTRGPNLKEPKELAAAYRKLARAGFSTQGILGVLRRVAAEPELVDSFEPPEPEEPQS